MIGHESTTERLKALPAAELDAELRKILKDTLPALVAKVQQDIPLEGNTLHSCVVDDIQPAKVEWDGSTCRVQVRFAGQARREKTEAGDFDRLAGRAVAVIGEDGHVKYRDVALAREEAFLPPDVGGGD